tara:strand:- start:1407 stop:1589 length:183 start_codon:yes stop_codon:yes gene_type:complete
MKINHFISAILTLASLGYIGYATYILNSLPDQILESKASAQKNKLQREIRELYNTQTAQP